MDLHSPQIQGFFSVPVDHLYARKVICDHVRSLNIPDLVICSPDVGFAKSASAYANLLEVPVVIGNKQRQGSLRNAAQVLEVIGRCPWLQCADGRRLHDHRVDRWSAWQKCCVPGRR
ncbi:MAG UNVERIFIED_CONTAM: hypothetical protein LVR18_37810 [Planctomycetaceae bacterium]|jgi:ribose-phosphate pyrophosphokinase